jgi:hypothetical protein
VFKNDRNNFLKYFSRHQSLVTRAYPLKMCSKMIEIIFKIFFKAPKFGYARVSIKNVFKNDRNNFLKYF